MVNSEYTGKERDSETGLDYFGARYMSSAQARFTSPDPSPSGVALQDPQSWNLYSYVRNRPTRFVDRNGNWATELHGDIVTAALQGYVSAGDLRQLVQQQYVMDRNQGSADSYQHFMYGNGENPATASQNAWSFIANHLEAASAGVNASGGFTGGSIIAFGDALHTIQDYTSPMHTNNFGEPKLWRGLARENFGALWHASGEDSPTDNWYRFGEAIRLTMAAFLQVNPVAARNAGLTEATFDQEVAKRISTYVQNYYAPTHLFGTSSGAAVKEDAARQCALGNPAACGL